MEETQRRALLKLARGSIEAKLAGKALPALPPISVEADEFGGLFVTLRKAGRLRGCMGRFQPDKDLPATAQEIALSALGDPPPQDGNDDASSRDNGQADSGRQMNDTRRSQTGMLEELILLRLMQDEIVRRTAELEQFSEHPLGEAVVAAAHERGLDLLDAQDVHTAAGHGISGTLDDMRVFIGTAKFLAEHDIDTRGLEDISSIFAPQGKTPILVGFDTVPAGVLAVADTGLEEVTNG